MLLTHDLIIQSNNLFEKEEIRNYRTSNVYLRDLDTLEPFLVRTPPSHEEVPPLMDNLIKKTNEQLSSGVILESITKFFADFLYIHPFTDSNGKTARYLTNSLLNNFGLNFIQFKQSYEAYILSLEMVHQNSDYSFLQSYFEGLIHFDQSNLVIHFKDL